MRKLAWALIALLPLGCASPNGSVANNSGVQKPVESSTGGQPTSSGSPNSTSGTTGSPNGEQIQTTSGAQPNPGETPNPNGGTTPPAGGNSAPPKGPTKPTAPPVRWSTTNVKADEIGKGLDNTIHELEDTVGQFWQTIQKGDGKGTDTGVIVIKTSNTFNIEYFPASKLGVIEKIRANSGKKAILTDKGWQSLPNVPASMSVGTIDLATWYDNFPKLIFRPLTDGQSTWRPLMAALVNNGYKVQVELSNQKVSEDEKPFYRIVAKPKSDSNFAMEVLIDGIRRLPLTIRLTKGKELRQWTAQYGFHQEMDPKYFELP